jgi:hypothetical protein
MRNVALLTHASAAFPHSAHTRERGFARDKRTRCNQIMNVEPAIYLLWANGGLAAHLRNFSLRDFVTTTTINHPQNDSRERERRALLVHLQPRRNNKNKVSIDCESLLYHPSLHCLSERVVLISHFHMHNAIPRPSFYLSAIASFTGVN